MGAAVPMESLPHAFHATGRQLFRRGERSIEHVIRARDGARPHVIGQALLYARMKLLLQFLDKIGPRANWRQTETQRFNDHHFQGRQLSRNFNFTFRVHASEGCVHSPFPATKKRNGDSRPDK